MKDFLDLLTVWLFNLGIDPRIFYSQVLLEMQASSPADGTTALHHAAKRGHKDAVATMIRCAADPRALLLMEE